jgi:hypothetical protein
VPSREANRIILSEDGLTVEGPEFTTEAKIIYALVMRLGGEATITAAEISGVTRQNAGVVIVLDENGEGCRVTAGPWPDEPLTHPVDILKDYAGKAGIEITPEREAAMRAECDGFAQEVENFFVNGDRKPGDPEPVGILHSQSDRATE